MALVHIWSGSIWKIFQAHLRHSSASGHAVSLPALCPLQKTCKDANRSPGVPGRLADTWGRGLMPPGSSWAWAGGESKVWAASWDCWGSQWPGRGASIALKPAGLGVHLSAAGLVGGESPRGGSGIWDSQAVGTGDIIKGQASSGGRELLSSK